MSDPHSIIWNSLEAAIVTGGRNTREWCASGVALGIDDIRPGDLFFASKEDDLNVVFQKGAAAVVLSHCTQINDNIPTLSVPSVFEALQSLARAARFKSHATILAVQGKKERGKIAETLNNTGTIHKAGRHLSLALAGLPDHVDYGVFGLSPTVQPDIAIITNCTTAHRDTLFEQMPAHGTVLVNADDDQFLSIVSRAKMSGINHIYTFGNSPSADIYVRDKIHAANGQRVSINLLGEEYETQLDNEFEVDGAFLAGLLVAKITGQCVSSLLKKAGPFTRAMSAAPNSAITLADPSLGAAQAVFRVTNMIDLGFGRQTAILDTLSKSAHNPLDMPKKSLAIPRKMDNLDFVYTSKRLNAVSNAREAIKQSQGYRKIETITPDVVAPGDFLVFKDVWTKSKAALSEALRIVPDTKIRQKRKLT